MDEETPRRFQADGHVILPSFLDASTLGAVEDEIASLGVRDPASFDKGHFFLARDGKTINQIEHMQRYASFFDRMMREDRGVLDTVESVLGDEVVCDNVSYMAKPARVGEVVPWHQDNAYYGFTPDDALSVWIALDDCDEENGCMRVVSGSHRRGLQPHGPTGARGISYGLVESIDPASEVNLELKRGDASLHHCATFHEGLVAWMWIDVVD